MFLVFYSLCMLFCFVVAILFQLSNSSRPRGTVSYATFPFHVGFRPFVSPPHQDVSLRASFDVGFPCLARVFPFKSHFFVSLPVRANSARVGFDGGCFPIAFHLFRPPATLALRGRFLTGNLLYNVVCV